MQLQKEYILYEIVIFILGGSRDNKIPDEGSILTGWGSNIMWMESRRGGTMEHRMGRKKGCNSDCNLDYNLGCKLVVDFPLGYPTS